jgi:hypothetical protein
LYSQIIIAKAGAGAGFRADVSVGTFGKLEPKWIEIVSACFCFVFPKKSQKLNDKNGSISVKDSFENIVHSQKSVLTKDKYFHSQTFLIKKCSSALWGRGRTGLSAAGLSLSRPWARRNGRAPETRQTRQCAVGRRWRGGDTGDGIGDR